MAPHAYGVHVKVYCISIHFPGFQLYVCFIPIAIFTPLT